MKDEVEQMIVTYLCEVRDRENDSPLSFSRTTPLFGENGILDSLGLVTLVISVEQAIEDRFGISVSLADEKALSQTHSPYRTVGTLAEYASSLLAATA